MDYFIGFCAGTGLVALIGLFCYWILLLVRLLRAARIKTVGRQVLEAYLSQLFQWGTMCCDDPLIKQLFRDLHGSGRFRSLQDYQQGVVEALLARQKGVKQDLQAQAEADLQTAKLRIKADENLTEITYALAGWVRDHECLFADHMSQIRFFLNAAETFTKAEQTHVKEGDDYDWYEAIDHYTATIKRNQPTGGDDLTTWELKTVAEQAVWYGLEQAAPDVTPDPTPSDTGVEHTCYDP